MAPVRAAIGKVQIGLESRRRTKNSKTTQLFAQLFDCTSRRTLGARNSEPLVQLVIKQAPARFIRLEPLAVNHQLRNSALAHVAHYLGRRRGIGIDINLSVSKAMRVKKPFCREAVTAPGRRIDLNRHIPTLDCANCYDL